MKKVLTVTIDGIRYRAMYGEKCFARLPAERWKIDSHRLSCIYMDLQESVYQS